MDKDTLTRRGFVVATAGGVAAWAGVRLSQQNSQIDEIQRRAQQLTQGSAQPASTGKTLHVRVIRRQGWGARPPQAPMQRHRPERLTLHHTAVLLESDDLSPARLRRHQDWHMDDPGHNFPDLAYHFMVDRRGNIFEGRKVRFRGDTATEYDTTGHFLVCCEGDYEQQEPTPEQMESVAGLFAWAAQRWDIKPNLVRGHGDYAGTTCPGTNLQDLVRDRSLRKRVRRLVRRRRVKLEYLSVARSQRIVGEIEAGEA